MDVCLHSVNLAPGCAGNTSQQDNAGTELRVLAITEQIITPFLHARDSDINMLIY